MSENLLDTVSKASKTTKKNISQFLRIVFQKEQTGQITKDQNNTQDIFNRNTNQFSIVKARQASKDQRSQKLLTNHQFNYGEISFHTIYEILKRIQEIRKMDKQQVFYDLGSGTGKVVFAAALCYPFIKCIGIQFLESLYNLSKKLQNNIQSSIKNIENEIRTYREQYILPKIQYINGDFKQISWQDGTIIFVSSTCYSKEVMYEIQKLCSKLEQGTIIVTLTRKLENVQGLTLKTKFEGTTSWGNSTIYIHIKQI